MNMIELMRAVNEILEYIKRNGTLDDVDSITIDTEGVNIPARLFVDYKNGIRAIYNYDENGQYFDCESMV